MTWPAARVARTEERAFVAVLKSLEQEPMYQSTQDNRAYVERELVLKRQIVEWVESSRSDVAATWN